MTVGDSATSSTVIKGGNGNSEGSIDKPKVIVISIFFDGVDFSCIFLCGLLGLMRRILRKTFLICCTKFSGGSSL